MTSIPTSPGKVVVYGATGYTGRRVAAHLSGSGWHVVVVGRDGDRVQETAAEIGAVDSAVASIHDPVTLLAAIDDGTSVVVNCAGPFAHSAIPVAAAAIRSGVHYMDISAEQAATHRLIAEFGALADRHGVALACGIGFFHAVAEATAAALASDETVEKVTIAYDIAGWSPTPASAAAISLASNAARLRYSNGGWHEADGFTQGTWDFGADLGRLDVFEYAGCEVLTLPRVVKTEEVAVWMTTRTFAEMAAGDAEGPRSGSSFVASVTVSHGDACRSTQVRGSDIYGITPAIVGMALQRLSLLGPSGVVAPSQLCDLARLVASGAVTHMST
jgi:saccharopine dehydrogenase-like NADP-dependent oxidoreductase